MKPSATLHADRLRAVRPAHRGLGKTTLLNIAVGLTLPTEGEISVLGGVRVGSPAALDRIAFVAQDMPLYRNLSVADMLHMTLNLNHAFDVAYARHRLDDLGIVQRRRIGKLSGGQRAQLAPTLALARHPRLLVLDEPTASLDPVARHDFMATVVTAMTDDGVSVILSSHALAELERVADYLVLLTGGAVRVDGVVDDLLQQHPLVTGPASTPVDRHWHVIESRETGARQILLVRVDSPRTPLPVQWEARPVGVEELALAYLRESPECARGGDPMTTSVLSPAPTMTPRPVPWHRLAWVTWRHYRTTLLAMPGLLAVVAGVLLARGHQMRDAFAAVQACTPQASASCGFSFSQFHDTYGNTGPIGALFVWMPALIGAFAGAPLLARELETDTFRYVWTQGAGRTRCMVALTAAGALGVAVLSAAFGLLITWYQQPLITSDLQQRLHTSVFPVTGIAVIGWALTAFRHRRVRRAAHPPRPASTRPHPGSLDRARLPRQQRPRPLPRTPGHQQPATGTRRPPHRPVVDQRRHTRHRRPDQPCAARHRRPNHWRRELPSRTRKQHARPHPIPHPARLHPAHELPARQPLLDRSSGSTSGG